MRITTSAMRQLWQCHVERMLSAGEMPMSYDEYEDFGRRLLEIEIVHDTTEVKRSDMPNRDYPTLIIESITGAQWLLGKYNGAPCYHLIDTHTVIRPPYFFYDAPGRLRPQFLEVGNE